MPKLIYPVLLTLLVALLACSGVGSTSVPEPTAEAKPTKTPAPVATVAPTVGLRASPTAPLTKQPGQSVASTSEQVSNSGGASGEVLQGDHGMPPEVLLPADFGDPQTFLWTNADRFTDISVGSQHTCAIRADGVTVCWPGSSGVVPPTGEQFTALTSGDQYSCGLRPDGSTVCWGPGSHITGFPSPIPDERFIALSEGTSHPCGVRSDGTLSCWSGAGDKSALYVPQGEQFVAVSIGEFYGEFSCGINRSTALLCWSSRLPARGLSYIEIDEATTIDDAIAAFGHSDQTYVWSAGDGKVYVLEEEPVVNLGEGFIAVSTGPDDVCGLKQSGDLICWGFGRWGSSVFDLVEHYPLPDQKLSDLGHGAAWFGYTSQRADYRCGISPDGSALCWFPDPATQDLRKVKIPADEKFLKVASGSGHTCGLLADGSIKCWGHNHDGEIMAPPMDAMPTYVPTDSGECVAGMSVPLGSGCQLSMYGIEPSFAVTDQGEAIFYDRGQVLQTQFGAMHLGYYTHSHYVVDDRTVIEHHRLTKLLAYANADGSWILARVHEWDY